MHDEETDPKLKLDACVHECVQLGGLLDGLFCDHRGNIVLCRRNADKDYANMEMWKFAYENVQRRIAFGMSMHERIGQEAPTNPLSPDTVQTILWFMSTRPTSEEVELVD